jgi:HAD superfamily hydrolase (TIGR01509 family)
MEPSNPVPLRALLVDIGGTLVPFDSIDLDWYRSRQLERLAAAFEDMLPWFEPILDPIVHGTVGPHWEQPTRQRVEVLLHRHEVALTDELFARIQAACATYLHEGARVEDGAYDALVEARRLGIKLAICSDVVWVTGVDARSDWQRLGFGELFDAFVTSEDVGYCKPHRAMFETALRELDVHPEAAAMIGDRPERDIAGAHALGLRTIWKRPHGFEGPCIPHPDAEVTSWAEALRVLRQWAR